MKLFGMNVIVSDRMPENGFMLVSQREGPPPSIEVVTWRDGCMKHYSGPPPCLPVPKGRTG